MRIYHYTSLESLALILQNKTIRFNRLDKVDDIEEGNVESLGIKFCKYIFVSCWTEDKEENIPLWKMYGGDFGGVRISMEKEMFREYSIPRKFIHPNLEIEGCFNSKIPFEDFQNPEFSIYPVPVYDHLFYRNIEYKEDISLYTKEAIQNNDNELYIDIEAFGTYKNKRWKFQNESRFVLYILPYNLLIKRDYNTSNATIAKNTLIEGKKLSFSYYDMHLREEAIDSMEITLSPSITNAQRVIVEALRDKYAPQAKILDSTLGKIVRLK